VIITTAMMTTAMASVRRRLPMAGIVAIGQRPGARARGVPLKVTSAHRPCAMSTAHVPNRPTASARRTATDAAPCRRRNAAVTTNACWIGRPGAVAPGAAVFAKEVSLPHSADQSRALNPCVCRALHSS